MGRGTPEDAKELSALGISVHLNASETEKWAFLQGADVFFTPSLWEGFNLPLVEAQACGAVGLAYDTGAHPETTPFVFGSQDQVVEQIAAYSRNAELLAHHRGTSRKFVARFRWCEAVNACIQVCANA